MAKNKTVKKKNKVVEYKKDIYPDWRKSSFAKTIDGQMMILLEGSIKNGYMIEAHTLSWSIIEQLTLPRLISWIAKELKLELPKDIYKLNSQSVNYIYLCISHDKKLYDRLELSRKKRNKIVHKLTSLGDKKEMKKLAKESTRLHVKLLEEMHKRLHGEVLIPSINLYKNGWNDGLKKVLKEI